MQSVLEQFNYSSLTYYKTLLMNQFEYRIETSVLLEQKIDLTKFWEVRPILQSAEISIILKTQEDIRRLENLYTFENFTDIRRFLWIHQFLIEILFEAQKQIIGIFDEQITLSLDLHRDPEEGWDELFIVIKSPYSAEKAVELERKLFEEWFTHRIHDTKGKLNFTEEPL